jgi:tetratricopeptide (TPR) repeat protein/transcriptional regulator with XRE-family HTH domain
MAGGSEHPFGEFLRACRLAAGHTQESLADASGVSTRAISYLETGRVRHARRATVQALVSALGVEFDARARMLDYGSEITPAGNELPVPSQLPLITSVYVGREADLAGAAAAISNGGTMAVCGMPGVGKTTFAVQVAASLRSRFPDGLLFVDLHGFDEQALNAEQALGYLLRAILGSDTLVPAVVDEQSAMLRSALSRRRALVIFDNARDEAQVRPLLPAGLTCASIVTSRNVLAGLDTVHRVDLNVLDSVDSTELIARIAGAERTHADPRGTLELVRWCGGLPLAIRIVAARLAAHPAWQVADLARRLADQGRRLSELAVGDLAVNVAFDLSYRMLSEPERQLFRRLGLIPGSDFGAAAAALLADLPADEAQRLMEALAHANLLQQASGTDRYRMHDLVRLYAAQRAQADDQAAGQAIDRLNDWYLAAADMANGLVTPGFATLSRTVATTGEPLSFATAQEAMSWLEAERANLVAAVLRASRSGRGSAAWHLADALRGFFYVRRYTEDWLTTARAGLRAARAAGSRTAQAAMLASLGMARLSLGQYRLAVSHYRQAAVLADEWPRGQAAVLGNLGIAHYLWGHLDEAEHYYRLSLQINREVGNRHGEGIRLGNLAELYHAAGEFAKALRHYDEAFKIYRELGYQHGEALTLCNFADIRRDMGSPEEAVEHASTALAIAAQLQSQTAQALAERCLAAAYRDLGQYDEALAAGWQAVSLSRALGDATLEVDSLNTLANVERDIGDRASAAVHHADARAKARRAGFRQGEIDALIGLARSVNAAGRSRDAIQYARQAFALAVEHRHRLMERRAQAVLSELSSGAEPTPVG